MNAHVVQPFAMLLWLASQQFRGCRHAGAMVESGVFVKKPR